MSKRPASTRPTAVAAIIMALLCVSPTFAGPVQETSEASLESLFQKAESHFQTGEYDQAVATFLQAASLSREAPDLSRAYFGLSQSYFYLRDFINSKKYMIEVLKVDPNREISDLFYPEGFVQIFWESRMELQKGQEKAAGERAEESVEAPQPEKPEMKEPEAQVQQPASETQTKPSLRETGAAVSGAAATNRWEGKFEVEFHASTWGLGPLKWAFEDSVTDELGEGIRNEVTDQLRSSHPLIRPASYEEDLALDSGGSNYGLEARFYPAGKKGFFSLGFSLEKTKMRVAVSGKVRQNYAEGSFAEVDSEAYIETSPSTIHLNFRWDFLPSRRVSPYFVLGFGLAPLKGKVGYIYSGTFHWTQYQETIEGNEIKTFEEAEQEEDFDFDIPDEILILQLSFGLKAEVYKGLILKFEAGIWDGFCLRAGLAYRF